MELLAGGLSLGVVYKKLFNSLPSSGVYNTNGSPYGPVPTFVWAAMMQMYVLNGLRFVTVRLVLMENSQKLSPVSTVVTLIT